MTRVLSILLLLCAVAMPAPAQGRRSVMADQVQRRNDDLLREAFRPVVAEARQSVVTIRCAGKDVALGTIVGEDGWVITKASELTEKISCRLRTGRELAATVVSVNEEHDLALLKVNARDLRAVKWGDSSALVLGQFVVTAGAGVDPVATGVLSVGRRRVASRGSMLGVQLEDNPRGPRVVLVVDESGASRAGIKPGDIILAIAGKPTPGRMELSEVLRDHRIGTSLKIKLLRDDREMEVSATLGRRQTTQPSRSEMMNQMGGPLSNRNNGFPDVFQHDTVLKPTDCGSPVVDIDGRVIGINIARAGRTESYAIPSDVVAGLVEQMKPATPAKAGPTTRPAKPR